MKFIKTSALHFLLIFTIACTSNNGKVETEKLQQENNEPQLISSSSSEYLDSIRHLNSEMEQFVFLTLKKDSLRTLFEQTEFSLEQIKSHKIEPGIEGINVKLNELKGQKENLQDQQDLQKQEIELAEKKIELLEDEEAVYAAQHKALWDKGAAPADFEVVDSLLNSIKISVSEQSNKVKNLKRNVGNIQEQVNSIDVQRNSLSTKIRNNYTAQKIFEEYSAEQKQKLEEQINEIEKQLGLLQTEENELGIKISSQIGEKNSLQIKQNKVVDTQRVVEAQLKEEALAKQKIEVEKNKRKGRILTALLVIFIVAIVLFGLYFVGKIRKSRKSKLKN